MGVGAGAARARGGGGGQWRRRYAAAERSARDPRLRRRAIFLSLALLACVAGRAAGVGGGGGGGWLCPPLLSLHEMGWAGPATCANFGSGPHTTKLLPFFFGHHKTSSFINHTTPCMSALVCWKHDPW